MSHFAKIVDGAVTQVVVASGKEWCETHLGGTWIQTSYNTKGNQHPEGKPLHKNYAGIGHLWDGVGFYTPQPYPSWTKNADTYLWEAPIPRPIDDKTYAWDEDTTSWVEVE